MLLDTDSLNGQSVAKNLQIHPKTQKIMVADIANSRIIILIVLKLYVRCYLRVEKQVQI